MITKFRIKPQYIDCTINTKDKSGNDVNVDKHSFNDYFADLIFAAGQGHLLEPSPNYVESVNDEKKTFVQLSENAIALTYEPIPTDLPKQKQTRKKRR